MILYLLFFLQMELLYMEKKFFWLMKLVQELDNMPLRFWDTPHKIGL
jgi:hypothetical protein